VARRSAESRESRLSLERCRALLGECEATDEELETVREGLYVLAEGVLDAYPTPTSLNFERARRTAPCLDWEQIGERAAIREHEGGQPRDEAERAAIREVLSSRRDTT